MSTPSGRRANVRSRSLAGIQKHDSLSKFFDSVLDGTADLTTLNAQAADEEFVPDEKDLEIERMQEAQRIALAHGGFTDLIDFEEAIKNGAGADFHEKNGYPGMMGGGMPKKKAKADGTTVQVKRLPLAPREARTVSFTDNKPETLAPVAYETTI